MYKTFSLLHEDTGKVSFDRFNSFNSHIKLAEKIRLEYHRGGELTTECLYMYMNRKFQMYVNRKEIDTIKHSEKRPEPIKWSERSRDLFLITHDASGGGSTVVCVVLYELRQRCPCIVVKQFSDFLHEGLQLIYQKSRLPLVILIDDFELSRTDRTLFLRQFQNNEIKA